MTTPSQSNASGKILDTRVPTSVILHSSTAAFVKVSSGDPDISQRTLISVSSSQNRPTRTISDGNTATINPSSALSADSLEGRPTPMSGEKPNDLLLRLYDMWPSQLTKSYRPNVVCNPEATAEQNLRGIREQYPTKRKSLRRAKAAGVVVETVVHLDKRIHYSVNVSR